MLGFPRIRSGVNANLRGSYTVSQVGLIPDSFREKPNSGMALGFNAPSLLRLRNAI